MQTTNRNSSDNDKISQRLKIHVYSDGAQKDDILNIYRGGFVKGFTTNPTLMAKAGIRNYEEFAKSLLSEIKDLPISFEVFSDDFEEMERQADKIASWGSNVNIKIPITNTKGEPSLRLIRRLLDKSYKLNVTAIMTDTQTKGLKEILNSKDDVIVSIFAGRIADTGIDPIPIMKKTVNEYKDLSGSKILWASPRETLNIFQANDCGCHIITATPDLIKKLSSYEKNLNEFSLETVKMFYDDAKRAGFSI